MLLKHQGYLVQSLHFTTPPNLGELLAPGHLHFHWAGIDSTSSLSFSSYLCTCDASYSRVGLGTKFTVQSIILKKCENNGSTITFKSGLILITTTNCSHSLDQRNIHLGTRHCYRIKYKDHFPCLYSHMQGKHSRVISFPVSFTN